MRNTCRVLEISDRNQRHAPQNKKIEKYLRNTCRVLEISDRNQRHAPQTKKIEKYLPSDGNQRHGLPTTLQSPRVRPPLRGVELIWLLEFLFMRNSVPTT